MYMCYTVEYNCWKSNAGYKGEIEVGYLIAFLVVKLRMVWLLCHRFDTMPATSYENTGEPIYCETVNTRVQGHEIHIAKEMAKVTAYDNISAGWYLLIPIFTVEIDGIRVYAGFSWGFVYWSWVRGVWSPHLHEWWSSFKAANPLESK